MKQGEPPLVVKDWTHLEVGVLVEPHRRVWVSLAGVPDREIGKLALIGLGEKLRRIISRGNRSPAEREAAIRLMMSQLRAGRWQARVPSRKDLQREEVLDQIRKAAPKDRPTLVGILRKTGVIDKLGITPEDIEQAQTNKEVS